MNICEIREAYINSSYPSSDITDLIDKICITVSKIKNNKQSDKSNLLSIFNIISNSNKNNILIKFENFVTKWNDECNSVFLDVICRQYLYTDIYIEMFKIIPEEYQNKLVTKLLSLNTETSTSNELKTVGLFLAKWFIYIKKDSNSIYKYYSDELEDKAPLVINSFITFCKQGESGLIPTKIYNKIKKIKLSTSSQLLLYDLEDLMDKES
tara:strand:- start:1261 stop:1890 length:630 start_codon:yes stop_codon:yes gene_type:complete